MLEIIITSSILIGFLILLRYICRNRISRRLQYALWLLAAVRLLVPVTLPGNPLSVMNLLHPAAERVEAWGETEVFPADREAGPQAGRQAELWMDEGLPEASAGNGMEGPGGNSDVRPEPAMGAAREETAEKTHFAGRLTLGELERILDGSAGIGFSVRQLLGYIWLTGAAVMGIWMGGCNVLFRVGVFRVRELIGKKGRIRVYVAEGIGTPCLLGVLSPAVYLTPDSARNGKYREYALAHELTHYRHGDHIWIFIRNLCLVFYWFNPLVWIGAGLAARDCELACDEGVIGVLGEEHAREYGCTLIEMAATSRKGQRILRCETGLAFEKRELKERIARIAGGKNSTGVLAAFLAIVCGAGLAACTFGGMEPEPAMGRYVETGAELPGGDREYLDMAQYGETIRLIAAAGADSISLDGGVTFERVEAGDMPPGVLGLYEKNYLDMAGSVGGARAFRVLDDTFAAQGSEYGTYLLTEGGKEICLESLKGDYVCPFYSNGSFYLVDSGVSTVRFYKMDPVTGEMWLLMENQFPAVYAAAGEKTLYLVSRDEVLLYDLEKEEKAGRQDQTLSDFVAENGSSWSEEPPVLLQPWGNGVYILTRGGIYWHELYGESVEQVVDGGFCSIGDIDRKFTGMAIRETEGVPEFLVLYDNSELMRYTYDDSLPAVPEALRVFSVYEDSQVMRAVNGFRRKYPEIPVIYEAGMNSEYGKTMDDVLKNLATEIAAGNGPDILVMDDIPFDSYAEKGVLADLSDLREGMRAEDWFVNVIDAFAKDGKLYAIPMTFSVPVLGGKAEKMTGVETLEDLADLLEREKARGREDHVFCTWDAESTLRLLAQSSQGAWMRDGAMDREAVTEFLAQAKRIYDIRLDENRREEEYRIMSHNLMYPGLWIGAYDQYPLARRFDSDGIFCMLEHGKHRGCAEFYAGFVSGGERDYMMLHGIQEYYGESIERMPGQRYGSCLASSLLAVNGGTEFMQESRAFLEYAVSREFFAKEISDNYLLNTFNGTPINRAAYFARQQTEAVLEGYKGYSSWGISDARTEYEEITLDWPSMEDYGKLTAILDGITGVNLCDPVVYEAVMEYGEKALTGERSIEEAADAVEKRVKIYLAE